MSSKSKLHARSRRALLWGLGLFFLIQLAGGFVLDRWGESVRFPEAQPSLTRLQQEPRAEVVCVGSSRMQSICPDPVVTPYLRHLSGNPQARCQNAFVPAGDLITSHRMLKKMLEMGKAPEVLVVEVSPEVLARRNQWMQEHVRRQFTWKEAIEHGPDILRSGTVSKYARARFLPLYTHRYHLWKQFQAWLLPSTIPSELQAPTDPLPMSRVHMLLAKMEAEPFPPLTPAERRERFTLGIPDLHRWLEDYRIGGTAARALEEILILCREHGIRPILLAVPAAEPHRACYSAQVNELFLQHIRALHERYDFRFVDHRARVPDAYFRDHHHMSAEGGQFYALLFTREVLAPTWGAPGSRELSQKR